MPGGADVTEVFNFDALRNFISNEEQLIAALQQRTPSRFTAGQDSGDTRGPFRSGTPLIITTESFAQQGRYILFWSGAENTQWSFPMRAAQQQTRSGTILHMWRDNSRSTFFDEPQVTFTFQSGNILPVRLREQGQIDTAAGGVPVFMETVTLPPGLLDFYDFFDLLNEEKILSDGRPNFVYIVYHSLVFPEIFLRGFFTPEGFSFTDSSQDPASITWTATFKIRSTEPPFYRGRALMSTWLSAITGQGQVVDSTSDTQTTGGG